MEQSEWLGELAFTHYYKTLTEVSGVNFPRRWNALTTWERHCWIETAQTIADVSRGTTIKTKGLFCMPALRIAEAT